MSWELARVERAKKLFADGLSASQIAKELGGFGHCQDGGRSAICGLLYRLGLSRGNSRRSGTIAVPSMGRREKPAQELQDPARAVRRGRELPRGMSANIAAGAKRADKPTPPKLGSPPLAPSASPKISANNGGHLERKLTDDKLEENEAVDLPADQSPFAVTFADVTAAQCRWPIGDPSNLEKFRFCGAPKGGDGCPYCNRHRMIAGAGHGRSARSFEETKRGRPAQPFAANPVDPFN